MSNVRTPHFKVPFDLDSRRNRFDVVEQDSEDEIGQCVEAMLRTRRGSRVNEPEYGLSELAFQEGDIDLVQIMSEIGEWEPRAAFTLSEEWIAEEARTVHVNLNRQESQ